MKYEQLAEKLTKNPDGIRRYRYSIDPQCFDTNLKKAFYKPKNVFRIYFLLPGKEEWILGYMTYCESKMYFSTSFSDISGDLSNLQYFYSLSLTQLELKESPFPHIICQRTCDSSPLKLSIGFGFPHKHSVMDSKVMSAGLEFLFYSLIVASEREIGTDETEIIESCGMVCLSFRNVRIKSISENWMEKSKDNNLYLNIRCYPYNEFIRISTDESNSIEREVYLYYIPHPDL